jgi:transcriptional regulator with XRE-family HTH domain
MPTPRPPRSPHPGLGRRLAKRRVELDISSQDEAANRCHISPGAYAGAENGTTYPRNETLGSIAKGFKLELDELLALRDGQQVNASVSPEDQAVDTAADRLRELRSPDVRRAVIGLINELHEALGPES